MKIEAVGKPPGCKLLRISAEFTEPLNKDCTLRAISIRGDFFAMPEEKFEIVEERLLGTRLGDFASVFDSLIKELGIQVIGISGAGMLATLRGAIGETSIQDPANRVQ